MADVASTSSVKLTQDLAFQAETFKRLHPRAYLERFLAEGFRPDGREVDDWREVSVNVGSISTADGSALVRLGDTTVICGVKAEIAEPDLDNPENGFIVPNLDLPAICSPKFKPGPPVDEAQVLSERLNDAFIASGVIPLSSLCIQRGKAVWVLYIDATCINFDGNAFDATLIAMLAALKNTRLPQTKFDEESGQTSCTRKIKNSLQIVRIPISVSFGIFDSVHTLSDPSSFEEPLLDTKISTILDEKGELVSVLQSGSCPQNTILGCITAAKSRGKVLSEIIDAIN